MDEKDSKLFRERSAKLIEILSNQLPVTIEEAKAQVYWLKESSEKSVHKRVYSKISFEEMSRLGIELLSKQPPVTIEQAKAQVKWLKDGSVCNSKKR
jgi:hypothetical protein